MTGSPPGDSARREAARAALLEELAERLNQVRRREIRARYFAVLGFVVPSLMVLVLVFFFAPSIAPSVDRWTLVASVVIFVTTINGAGMISQVKAIRSIRRIRRRPPDFEGIPGMLELGEALVRERPELIDELIRIDYSGDGR